jgi:hypothetical protein
MIHTNAEPIRPASRPSPCRREFAYGIVPHTLAIMVILCLGSLTAERAVGQVPEGAVANTSDAAEREHSK